MKSSVKKIYSLILSFALVFLAVLSTGLFSIATPANSVSAVSDTSTRLFDYFAISEEGRVFSDKDLVNIDTAQKTDNTYKGSATLYSNKAVTISFFDSSSSIQSNAEYIEKTIGGTTYYTFLLPAVDTQTSIVLKTTKTVPVSHNGQTYYQQITVLDFTLTLIQTTTDFNQNVLDFEYEESSTQKLSHALTQGKTYSSIAFSTRAGSALNPLFVEFVYNGEKYALKNIDGQFYIVTATSDTSLLGETTEEQCIGSKIVFEKYGIYQLKVYDNYDRIGQTFNFFINQPTFNNTQASELSPLFIYAKTSDGELILNTQRVNSNVTIFFGNLSSYYDSALSGSIQMYNKVGKITISQTLTRQNANEKVTITYTNDKNAEHKISELADMYTDENKNNSAFTFSEDGTYEVAIYDQSDTQKLYFKFTIIQDIRNTLELGEHKLNAEEANVITEHTIDYTVEGSYNYTFTGDDGAITIPGYTKYYFTVKIAKSEPGIVGTVSNGEKVKGSVALKVYGVGDIKVNVTQDGELVLSETYQNGDVLPTFSKLASYKVTIVDQMGMTSSISFTISESMNAATLILIIVGSIVGVGLIVFIIISRSKVKVR